MEDREVSDFLSGHARPQRTDVQAAPIAPGADTQAFLRGVSPGGDPQRGSEAVMPPTQGELNKFLQH